IEVDGAAATFKRDGRELIVTPKAGLPKGKKFTVVVSYAGTPHTVRNSPIVFGAPYGWIYTDDGAFVGCEPNAASTWYPSNDHPSDKASYTFHITVPDGLEAIANGLPRGHTSQGGWATWDWEAVEPMATYLTTATIGEFDLDTYTAGGIRYVDAIDPDLLAPVATPRTGSHFAISRVADSSYKRLTRTVTGGGMLQFGVDRQTEPDWDFMFVEVRTPGGDDWTTLPDVNGHTSPSTGESCPDWLAVHPFLSHYQSPDCSASGTSGRWYAASGSSQGWEQWAVDLSAYPGEVEVSISYVSDTNVQEHGVFVDDITVPSGPGTTSFEPDGDMMDGWQASGPPAGSPPLPNNWIVGGVADTPPSPGEVAAASFARQPEILDFLASVFGPYPFSAAGGILDEDYVGDALENQTRPIYPPEDFGDSVSGDNILVHELAHQWYGDSLALADWQHIWLNEGFATYAEWLWSEQEGLGTAQEIFENTYNGIPANAPFWNLRIGDPGGTNLFADPVYDRGGMTLHALRLLIGDDDFFRLLPTWTALGEDANVTTAQFVALAEQISGQQLDAFFQEWLFTPAKPAPPPGATVTTTPDQSGPRIIEGRIR
ncbi:MAG: hypothetical protein H0T54_01535, partial [Geodermatophilaceae bacterium]|nr:hypothetical protein [Geodermatophilaceae bacterium]